MAASDTTIVVTNERYRCPLLMRPSTSFVVQPQIEGREKCGRANLIARPIMPVSEYGFTGGHKSRAAISRSRGRAA